MLQTTQKRKALDLGLGFGYISDSDSRPEPRKGDIKNHHQRLSLAQSNYTHLESPHPSDPNF